MNEQQLHVMILSMPIHQSVSVVSFARMFSTPTCKRAANPSPAFCNPLARHNMFTRGELERGHRTPRGTHIKVGEYGKENRRNTYVFVSRDRISKAGVYK